MTFEQKQILQLHFDSNPDIDSKLVKKLAAQIQESRARVYKWFWDRKRRPAQKV